MPKDGGVCVGGTGPCKPQWDKDSSKLSVFVLVCVELRLL